MGPMTAMATAAANQISDAKKIPINVKGDGGSEGIKCVIEKSCEIGLVPNVPGNLKSDVIVTELGKSAMGFLVTNDVTLTNITTAQVKDIFSGKIKNWKEIGGPDQTILVRDRKPGRGAREVFEKTFEMEKIFDETAAIGSFQELTNRLKFEFEKGKGITGLITYDAAYQVKKSQYVKVLSLDGVEPSPENVLSGKYKFLLNYFLIIHKDNANNESIKEVKESILRARSKHFPDMGVVFKE